MCTIYQRYGIKRVYISNVVHLMQMFVWNLKRFPMFHNLTHMELDQLYIVILAILPHFPNLQHFITQCARRGKGFWKYPPTVPDCLSSQLKTCCVRSYIGTEYEFKFVKYIMQHSNVLETMTIQSTCLENDRMKLKLSSCKRGSTTCKLLFDRMTVTPCF